MLVVDVLKTINLEMLHVTRREVVNMRVNSWKFLEVLVGGQLWHAKLPHQLLDLQVAPLRKSWYLRDVERERVKNRFVERVESELKDQESYTSYELRKLSTSF